MNASDVLRDHQKQIDEDGTLIGVSRQAVDEVLDELAALKKELQALREQKPVAVLNPYGGGRWLFVDHYCPASDVPINLYAAPVPASEGYVLVPIDPTDEMLYMMCRAINSREEKCDSYAAMLAAAPKEQALK